MERNHSYRGGGLGTPEGRSSGRRRYHHMVFVLDPAPIKPGTSMKERKERAQGVFFGRYGNHNTEGIRGSYAAVKRLARDGKIAVVRNVDEGEPVPMPNGDVLIHGSGDNTHRGSNARRLRGSNFEAETKNWIA